MEDKSAATAAVLYKVGDLDLTIPKIEDKLVELNKENHAGHMEVHIPLGTFDVKIMKRRTNMYYRYFGSLTTPPCKEKVNWNILGKVRSLSKKQLELLKAPLNLEFKHNTRLVQPLNGRKIEMYSAQNEAVKSISSIATTTP